MKYKVSFIVDMAPHIQVNPGANLEDLLAHEVFEAIVESLVDRDGTFGNYDDISGLSVEKV